MADVSGVFRGLDGGMAFAVPESGMCRNYGDSTKDDSRQTNGRHNGHEKAETSI